MKELTIRNAGKEDISELADMVGQTVRQINIRDYTPAQVDAWAGRAGSPDRWEELFNSGLTFFVAQSGAGEILGVSSANTQGYLHSLFVHFRFQGKGIGSQLLDTALRYVRACGTLKMTSEVSTTALPFFLRKGFVMIRRQEVEVNGVWMENFLMEKELEMPVDLQNGGIRIRDVNE